MRKLQKEAWGELEAYLNSFSYEQVMRAEGLPVRLEKAFKKLYPLLLLERGMDRKAPWSKKERTEQFRLYLRETISDIAQSLLLAAGGFYKPAQLSLRSGLENWVRCAGLAQDQSVLSLGSVFELMELVKSTPAISSNKLAKQYFSTLRSRYSALCGYVHTSNASHMALTTTVGSYPRYIKLEAETTLAAIEEVATRVTWMFCLLAEPTYRGLHHSHFDIVSDALPSKLKQLLNS